MLTVYEEIKDLALKFPQTISKDGFTKLISHISGDVNLTNQINAALTIFDTYEDKRDYLKNYLISLEKTDLADLEVMKKDFIRGIQNRCEKAVELELSLDETREKYNNVLRNSNNKALQKKFAFLERNLEQLTNVKKQLVEQNSSLEREVVISERNLLARNERIQALEALLQDAQEKLTTQNQKFEAQL
ncbi:hypothetical protein RhiirA4_549610 [Rhizophagus irregularis]|uniref:Uncharacterized protein n=1 Tax=Rhizophagus irregularis TaxID=588596 RepID=A0A2I1HEN5_9GLOM|nr:hypothetical protein RhiirA4_549610 [Rhizophagus irregularis]